MDGALARFGEEAATYLSRTYPDRLERALAVLPPGDLWWRPHPEALACGTVLLHLEGNVRQWILSGLAGAPDGRDRASEFAAAEGEGPALLEALRTTCCAAAEVLRGLPAGEWAREVTIQGFETTVLAAVLHVVEHFSWHTGQVVWIAKARSGADHGLAFYDDAALARARNGPSGPGARPDHGN